jgi:hypothetical protein
LAEFGVAIKVFYRMIVRMSNGIGGADIGAGKAGYAVICVFDYAEALFLIQLENLGRADVDAQFTPSTRLFVNIYFQ